MRARTAGAGGGTGGSSTSTSGGGSTSTSLGSGGPLPAVSSSSSSSSFLYGPPSSLFADPGGPGDMAEWEELKRKVRTLESRLEEKCQAYSFLAQRMNSDLLYDEENPLMESSEEQSLAQEIEGLLAALSECNDAMGRLLAQGARTSSSALLQRYREILFYYTTEFQKTSVAIQRKKESAELLRGSAPGGRRKTGTGDWGNPQMDQLLRERNAIHSSLRSVGNILSQAMETKDGLRAQRHSLQGTNTTLSGLSSNLPSITRIVDAIQRKKTRDNAIIGLIIAACICFTIWYL